jgi:hypothetical protein
MEIPPLTNAPLAWLETVVSDLSNETDDRMVDFQIRSAEDKKHYDFAYKLGEIRTELHKRTAN